MIIYGYRDFGPISNGDEYGVEESEQSGGIEGKHKLGYTALQEASQGTALHGLQLGAAQR